MNINEFLTRFEEKKQLLSYEKAMEKEGKKLSSLKITKDLETNKREEKKEYFPKTSSIREDKLPKKKRIDRKEETKHQDLPSLYGFINDGTPNNMILFIEAIKIKMLYEGKGFNVSIKDYSSNNEEEGLNSNHTTYGKVLHVENTNKYDIPVI